MSAYYNEIDPKAAAWLRKLIKAGLIAPGDVDERSIEDVRPDDLVSYQHCHFFAGIGGWDYALQLARWGNRPAWTGSPPCQPWSVAGKGEGFDDDRHLWPAWLDLIRECRPECLFGEQVSSRAGIQWLDAVHDGLEEIGYRVGATVLPACGVGAPHRRERIWFVADTRFGDAQQRGDSDEMLDEWHGTTESANEAGRSGATQPRGAMAGYCVADADGKRPLPLRDGQAQERPTDERSEYAGELQTRTAGCGGTGILVDSNGSGSQSGCGPPTATGYENASVTAGFWSNAEWLPCRDGKARPVEPGVAPLASGVPARVVRLRGYGNSIIPQVAAEFIRAYVEASPCA